MRNYKFTYIKCALAAKHKNIRCASSLPVYNTQISFLLCDEITYILSSCILLRKHMLLHALSIVVQRTLLCNI